jgi:chemotaxis protein methyltransferase CheR
MLPRSTRVEIAATDISGAAIEQARRGEYSHFEIQRGLPIRSLAQWFSNEGDVWRASPTLRAAVRFDQRPLTLGHPGRVRFDIVLCRNVMLYFSTDMRRKMFDRLADAMHDDGLLLLGAGETVIGQTERFAADRQLRGLYRPVTAGRALGVGGDRR